MRIRDIIAGMCALLLSPFLGSGADAARSVGVEEFAKLAQQPDTVILDVRTEREFKAGHIKGAINLDVNGPDFEKALAALDKTKTFLVHCAAGVRSVKACKKMAQMNFPKLVNLTNGFMGWQQAGKPVEK
jgi:phage shock protein E